MNMNSKVFRNDICREDYDSNNHDHDKTTIMSKNQRPITKQLFFPSQSQREERTTLYYDEDELERGTTAASRLFTASFHNSITNNTTNYINGNIEEYNNSNNRTIVNENCNSNSGKDWGLSYINVDDNDNHYYHSSSSLSSSPSMHKNRRTTIHRTFSFDDDFDYITTYHEFEFRQQQQQQQQQQCNMSFTGPITGTTNNREILLIPSY